MRIADIFVKSREEIAPQYVTLWEQYFGTAFWDIRDAWFKKPLAYLQTPYQRTIWVDCDCEILTSIAPLFDCCDHTGIAMRKIEKKMPPLGSFLYNSGVVAYQWGHVVLEQFADQTFDRNQECFSDDHLLTEILLKGAFDVYELPDYWNQTRRDGKREAKIVHWIGKWGKQILRCQLSQKNLKELYQ